MKSAYLLLATISIFLCSCGKGNQPNAQAPSKNVQTTPEQAHKTTAACEYQDYKVYAETVDLWKKAWADARGLVAGDGNADRLIDIPKASIRQLLDQCPTCDAVKIYFTAESEIAVTPPNPPFGFPITPGVALVNVDSCRDTLLVPDGVLKANSTTHVFVDAATAEPLLCNWKTFIDDYISSANEAYFGIYAYTFERNRLLDIINDSNENHVRIEFALHSVSPSNPLFFDPVSTYPSEIAGKLAIDIVLGGATTNAPSLDFSMPCPRFCGKKATGLTCD